MKAVRDVLGEYTFSHRTVSEDAILEAASDILFRRLERQGTFENPSAASTFLRHRLGHLQAEVFAIVWLDTRSQVIGFETLFQGSVSSCSVHPREVIRAALRANASACIFSHNHPSGSPEPSSADRAITDELKRALALVDIRVLDHIVVGPTETVSFAQRGLL